MASTPTPTGDAPVSPAAAVVSAVPGARAALVLLLVINLFNYVDRSIISALVVPIQREFGATNAQMGWLVTGFLLTYMLASPVFGWLADRYSRWLLVGVGVVLWSLASGGSGLATSFAMLMLMRCLIGVGEAAYGPVAPTLISDLYPVAIRGRVLAWFYTAIPVGSAIGYILGSAFNREGHWQWAFILTVPPGILLGVLCFGMREPARGLAETTTAPPARRQAGKADYLMLARTPSFVLNCLAMTAFTFATGGISVWMPKYLEIERGVKPGLVGLAFGGILVVAGLLATILGGIAGDRLRARGFGGAYFLVSAVGMVLGFPFFIASLYVPFPYAWGCLAVAIFFIFLNTGPSNTALANVTHPAVRASAFALNIFVIHALGDAISPPIIGWIADRRSLKVGFMVVGFSILFSGALWAWGSIYLKRDTERAPHRLDETHTI